MYPPCEERVRAARAEPELSGRGRPAARRDPNYDYMGPTKLPRRSDKTPELPPGVGQIPMPYPGYGLEFSDGLSGHLKIRLRIRGDDMWIKDNVDLYVRFIREKTTSFDTAWEEDADWTYIAS